VCCLNRPLARPVLEHLRPRDLFQLQIDHDAVTVVGPDERRRGVVGVAPLGVACHDLPVPVQAQGQAEAGLVLVTKA
jgi:hypothetical protein